MALSCSTFCEEGECDICDVTWCEHHCHETPEPAHGAQAECVVCGHGIHYLSSPFGGWWVHDVHPADEHDAVAPGDQ